MDFADLSSVALYEDVVSCGQFDVDAGNSIWECGPTPAEEVLRCDPETEAAMVACEETPESRVEISKYFSVVPTIDDRLL